MSRHKVRLAKFAQRTAPDGRPQAIDVIRLSGEDSVYASLTLSTREPTAVIWRAPCGAE